MSIVTIESGNGTGYTVAVTEEGRLLADVGNVDRIAEPVSTQPQAMSVATTKVALTATSAEILAARATRCGLEIQNLGGGAIHIVLATSSTSATLKDRRIDPGAAYVFPAGVAYAGAVQARTAAGTQDIVATEFYTT